MPLCVGDDLHSNNNFMAICDQDGKRIFQKKLKNDPKAILAALEPYKHDVEQIAGVFSASMREKHEGLGYYRLPNQ